jgi:uncharacterized protein (TIGR00369 family)
MGEGGAEAAGSRGLSRISVAEFEAIMREQLPFAQAMGPEVMELSAQRTVFRLPYKSDFLRPGGTIGGPLLMALADLALYGAVMAALGPVVQAVTTNLNISFLRLPPPADIVANARLIKVGKRLAVGTVELFSGQDPDMVAHVSGTYSLPPR